MDINKEREAFQKFCEENFDFERHEQTYFDEQTQCYENDIGEDTESINMAWSAWQAAKTQAVPEWISVKDKLPPNDPYNREYWVYETLNNKVQHDYWVCPDTGLDQYFEPFFNNWSRTVTHWMPMVKYPDPPMKAQEPAND